jgi:hypothetical protein
MKNIYLVCQSDYYYENRIFDIHSKQNRDNAYYPYYRLREEWRRRGIALNTFDFAARDATRPSALLFVDVPANAGPLLSEFQDVPKYLILLETEVISAKGWDFGMHTRFAKIFTWRDDLIDNRRYFKINFPQTFPDEILFDFQNREKLCTMIAGNKRSRHPLELYSERVRAIVWFERNHPEDFDLYGYGWNEDRFSLVLPPIALKYVKPLARVLFPYYDSYRGRTVDKRETLLQYRFAISYENARNMGGYITEKIFDCFLSGCVPVYWGAGNIGAHIPKECFIERRDFPSYEELYLFLKSMDDGTFRRYQECIRTFLRGPKAYPFSWQYFVETLVREIPV